MDIKNTIQLFRYNYILNLIVDMILYCKSILNRTDVGIVLFKAI